MKIIALAILLSLVATAASAEGFEHIPAKFFTFIKNGQTDEAIDYLYDTNRWVSKNSDQVINLKSQLSKLNSLVGRYIFHELVSETRVGTRYAHLIYLVGYERQPLRYEIRVYKADQGWRFQGVSFDASLIADVKKLANQTLVK